MKTLNNILKITTGLILVSALVVSCIPKQESIGGTGQTLIKLNPDDGFISKALRMQSTTQTTTLLEVRKNAPNSAALQLPTTVVLRYDADTAILNAYNEENETEYIPLPPALHTLSPAITAGKITLNFDGATQDHGKSVMITIPNILNFDFSSKYALAFEIESVTGEGIISEGSSQTVIVAIGAANKIDGKYEVTGTFVDYVYDAAGTAYSALYPKTIQLITLGLSSAAKYDAEYGTYNYIFDSGGPAGFGAWTVCFTIDDNNNINVYNSSVDSPSRNRTAVLYTGPGAASNKFNPTTHGFDVSYQMSQINVTPILRNLVIEHFEYKGPR